MVDKLSADATFVGAFFFIFGSLLGSFANVVIYRLPLKKSVVFPGSHCPKCDKKIAWYDNIPIVGWFILCGKCRQCHQKISWRYPLVELIMGILFCALFYHFGWSWTLIEMFLFIFGLTVVSFIDMDHMILPDVFTLSGIVIGLTGALLNPEREFLSALLGVLMGGGFLWAIAYIYYALRKEEGMGGGDIKLLAWMGALLGWKAIAFIILSSSLIGSIIGVFVAIRSKTGLKSTIPFGPYLVIGALLFIFFGQSITHWYLNLFLIRL